MIRPYRLSKNKSHSTDYIRAGHKSIEPEMVSKYHLESHEQKAVCTYRTIRRKMKMNTYFEALDVERLYI